jgi:flagellar hook-associated protein 2
MSAISSPVYDPKSTATDLATKYVAAAKAILQQQSETNADVSTGLGMLGSALSSFQTAIGGLASSTKTVTAASATFSNTAVGSATAKSTAVSGTYSFYVEQLATAGQVAYGGITDSAAAGSGSVNVTLADGTDFQVDLANADQNFDGTLTAKEIAAAVNIAAGNNSRVTASTLTVNGQNTLVLTSNNTGAANSVSLDTSGVTNAGLKAQLDDPLNQKQLVTARDAIVWVGPQGTGTKVQQASNVFNLVDDVSFTIAKAQTAGDAPVTLTVGPDSSGTAANVQTFIDAYNKLLKVFDTVTAHGDASADTPVADAPFANDAGVAALRSRMQSALRAVTGGQSLISFGITAQRDGTLSLDTGRLNKNLAAHPGALDDLFGKSVAGVGTGVLVQLDTLARQWTNASTGQIANRTAVASKQHTDIVKRQDVLQAQYDNAYARYLKQFTDLQSLQSQMTGTSNLFTALFSSSSDN